MLNLFHEKQVDESKALLNLAAISANRAVLRQASLQGIRGVTGSILKLCDTRPHTKKGGKNIKATQCCLQKTLSHLAGELPLTIYPVELPTDKL